jgi:hypothetical protein
VLHIVFIITLLQLQTTTDVIIIMCGYEDPNCLVTCTSCIIIITTEILLFALIQIQKVLTMADEQEPAPNPVLPPRPPVVAGRRQGKSNYSGT